MTCNNFQHVLLSCAENSHFRWSTHFLISLFPMKQNTIRLTGLQLSVYFVFQLLKGNISDILVAYK